MQKSKGKNKDTKATSATVADKARKNIEAKQRTALEMNKDLQGLQTVEEELALLEKYNTRTVLLGPPGST